MNDDDIADLMRSAASTEVAPPAAFDHSDVVAGSHRITRRRRTLVGAAAGVVLVAGIGGAVVVPNLQTQPPTTAAAAAAPQSPRALDEASPDQATLSPMVAGPTLVGQPPQGGPPQGGPPQGSGAPPLGPGTATCANPQDPALRRLLDEVFPAARGAAEAATTDICRPGGGRGVNIEVTDGSAGGLLTVSYKPAGQQPDPASQDGTTVTQPTASGGTVSVTISSDGPGGQVPYADQVPAIANQLAPRL